MNIEPPPVESKSKSKQPEQITQSDTIELTEISDSQRLPPQIGPPEEDDENAAMEAPRYLKGWRLYMLTLGLCLSLLLSTLETTIVSTSLVSITNALQGFENRDWVVTSYLLTYTGFLVIYAKFSDIFGSKFMILLALLIFTVFSIACGAATGITELIVLRAFQGVGGSGIYSMVGIITAASIPPEKFGKYMGIISSVFAISSVLGPLLGGAITDHTTWRWVFLLNAPAGAAATGLIIFTLPSDFSTSTQNILARLRARFTVAAFKRLDLLGASLMLVASILVVYSLEEAGTRFAWGSTVIMSPLIVGICCWFFFVQYEVLIEKKKKGQEPIFPMRLLKDRILAGMLLNAFFTGFPFTSVVVNIPQRFQAVNASSPTHAGLLLLPLLLVAPFASALSGFLVSKFRVPPVYLIITGSALQFLGIGLLCTLAPTPLQEQKQQYVFEVIAGLGFGLVLTSLLTLIPIVVSKKDMPVVISAVTQVRVLGGTIGLAISTTVLNSFLKKRLREVLSDVQVEAIGQSLQEIEKLTEEQQGFVRRTFAMGYGLQMKILAGFCGVVFLTSLLMWERTPRRHHIGEEEIETASQN